MIACKRRRTHADDPEQRVYVPFAFDHQSGEWRSLVTPEGFYRTERGATHCSHRHFLMSWSQIQHLARRLRAFCEHPEFAPFKANGIDAEMIRGSARELAEAIEHSDPNIRRLFAAPNKDDLLRIGGVLYQPDPQTGVLRAVPAAEQPTRPLPDVAFLRSIRRALDSAERITSGSVSDKAIEDAIDMLFRRLQPADDPREPIQFVADQRFVEAMGSLVARVRAHTGQGVSAHALTQIITVFTYWRDRLTLANGPDASDHDVFGDEDLVEDPGPSDGVVKEEIGDVGQADPLAAFGGARPTRGRLGRLARGTGRFQVVSEETADPAPEDNAPDGSESAGDAPDSHSAGQKSRDGSPDDPGPDGTDDLGPDGTDDLGPDDPGPGAPGPDGMDAPGPDGTDAPGPNGTDAPGPDGTDAAGPDGTNDPGPDGTDAP